MKFGQVHYHLVYPTLILSLTHSVTAQTLKR